MVLPAAQKVTATLQRPNYDPAYQVLPLCVHARVRMRLIFVSVWATAAYGHTDGPLLLTSCSLVTQWHLFCVFKVHLLGNELSNTLRAREESIHPQEFLLCPDQERCKSMPIGFIFKTEQQRIITQETNKYYINNVIIINVEKVSDFCGDLCYHSFHGLMIFSTSEASHNRNTTVCHLK